MSYQLTIVVKPSYLQELHRECQARHCFNVLIEENRSGRLAFLRCEAPVFAWNPTSVRLLEKYEFEREGVMRKSVFKDGEGIDRMLYVRVAPW